MSISEHLRALRAKIGNDLIEVPTAGAWVFDDSRRLLLVRHSEGMWTNPGGTVEPFETPADTAVRETWEETGLHVELTRLIGVFAGRDHYIRYSNGDEVAFVAIGFEARVLAGELRPDQEEVIEARFFTHEEALALDLTPRKRREIERVFADSATPYYDDVRWEPPAV